jgi:hypothetical protein
MQTLVLENLLGEVYPNATFHDSLIESLLLDYVRGEVTFVFAIPVAERDVDPIYERGTLRFSGLLSFAVEPPRDLPLQLNKGLWVTSDGSLPDSRVNISSSLPTVIPENAFYHYFFVSDTNSFIVVVATEVRFEWSLTKHAV